MKNHQTIRNIAQDAAFDSYRYEYFRDRRWHAARITCSVLAEYRVQSTGDIIQDLCDTFSAHGDLIYKLTIQKAKAQRRRDVVLGSRYYVHG